jgi:molybdopterin molybdotransferase
MTQAKSIAEISAMLKGYDPQALSATDVLKFLSELVTGITDTEDLEIFQSLGRIVAQDVISPIDVPPHDNSAMDGFAFKGQTLSSQESQTLKVVGTALAGKAWRGQVAQGECVKIMTGAIMPQGLDTVIPQELCKSVTPESIVFASGLLKPGDNRRLRGEDIAKGQPALTKGTRITPAEAGLLASLGLPKVTVYRRLKVAYFSTGDEILSLGQAPRRRRRL